MAAMRTSHGPCCHPATSSPQRCAARILPAHDRPRFSDIPVVAADSRQSRHASAAGAGSAARRRQDHPGAVGAAGGAMVGRSQDR
ncbi:hypothetical protein BRM83_12160, partial [Xanthomonas oryzae pv. oryzae]